MTDEELRALVRDAVARHVAAATPVPTPGTVPGVGTGTTPVPLHPGFERYALSRGDDGDGACLIEPKVRCNHCGYCQSHGF